MFDLGAVQSALREAGLDGWLLYDFRGGNVLAQRVCDLESKKLSRRWFYYVPATGEPLKLVHAIEPAALDHLPGTTKTTYRRWQDLETGVGELVIGAGTVIGDLVHIAHNVRIGKMCVIAGQVGIAGSTVLEDHVMMGGQVGIADHLTIGKGARIAAKSGVIRDIAAGETVAGYPALPSRQWHRQTVALAKLAVSPSGSVTPSSTSVPVETIRMSSPSPP